MPGTYSGIGFGTVVELVVDTGVELVVGTVVELLVDSGTDLGFG